LPQQQDDQKSTRHVANEHGQNTVDKVNCFLVPIKHQLIQAAVEACKDDAHQHDLSHRDIA